MDRQRRRRTADTGPTGASPGGRGSRSLRPTMADVARDAGVSLSTVSRVANGYPHINDETRGRVRTAMARLGYVAHVPARALARGRSQVLGLLTQEVANSFSHAIISGVDEATSAGDYDFLLCTTHARLEKEAEYV